MILMNRYRRPQSLTILPLLLTLLILAGCGRPAGPQTDDRAVHADQHPVPFHEGEGTAVDGPSGSTASQESSRKPTGLDLPFHSAQSLPAGTLITVRLKAPISAENPGANASFEAIVDEPIDIDDTSVVPRGTAVSGRIESALASNVRRDHAFVRLALTSLQLADVNVPIQTSSLFVRGDPAHVQVLQTKAPPSDDSPSAIRIEKGRRLTFRLTEPVPLATGPRTPSLR